MVKRQIQRERNKNKKQALCTCVHVWDNSVPVYVGGFKPLTAWQLDQHLGLLYGVWFIWNHRDTNIYIVPDNFILILCILLASTFLLNLFLFFKSLSHFLFFFFLLSTVFLYPVRSLFIYHILFFWQSIVTVTKQSVLKSLSGKFRHDTPFKPKSL